MLGYYEVEHIGNLCEVTVGVNRKEFLEKFESESINKKHEEIKD